MSLADLIEDYIQSLIEQGEGMAEIQRAYIAERFRCAPSQVSYVITSRFSPERGYVIESRRGGGGFIRLTRVTIENGRIREIMTDIGPYLSQAEAYDYLERLHEDGHLDERTFRVMRAALSRTSLAMMLPERDIIRASIFKAMLNAYFGEQEKEE